MQRTGHPGHTSAMRCALAAAVIAASLLWTPQARADVDVRINIGNAPPPPHFVFRARPHERYFPGEGVYLVDDPGVGDNDMFRYHGYYWIFRDGYWYRSRSWRGPFMVIMPRYVPTVFYRMPPTRWRHHPSGPPRYVRADGDSRGSMHPGGDPHGYVQPQRGGSPPAHAPQAPNPPVRQQPHMNPPMREQPHMNPPMRERPHVAPPARGKHGDKPPGQQKKDDKGNDKGGGHGNK